MTIETKRQEFIKITVVRLNKLLDKGNTRMEIIDKLKDAGYQEDTIIMFLDIIKANKNIEVIS